MATIKRFEDIEAWKKARGLTQDIYRCSKIGEFARDYGLTGQIRRAAVSVMSNIAEGFERGGTAEFVQFLSVSRAQRERLNHSPRILITPTGSTGWNRFRTTTRN